MLPYPTIGLTGGMGTGKSTVARMIQEAGFCVVFADELGREVSAYPSPIFFQIVERFGDSLLKSPQEINRKALGELFARDPNAKGFLEGLIHPAVGQRLREIGNGCLEKGDTKPLFYESALIFEVGLQGEFLEVWLTDCPPEEQKRRILARDGGLSPGALEHRLSLQLSQDQKKQRAHRVISTEGSLGDVKSRVDQELERICSIHGI